MSFLRFAFYIAILIPISVLCGCIDEQIEETEKLPADLVKMASVLSQPIT
jgi:hypothetical protein